MLYEDPSTHRTIWEVRIWWSHDKRTFGSALLHRKSFYRVPDLVNDTTMWGPMPLYGLSWTLDPSGLGSGIRDPRFSSTEITSPEIVYSLGWCSRWSTIPLDPGPRTTGIRRQTPSLFHPAGSAVWVCLVPLVPSTISRWSLAGLAPPLSKDHSHFDASRITSLDAPHDVGPRARADYRRTPSV